MFTVTKKLYELNGSWTCLILAGFLIFGMRKTLARRLLLEILTQEVAGPGFGGPKPLQPVFGFFETLETCSMPQSKWHVRKNGFQTFPLEKKKKK